MSTSQREQTLFFESRIFRSWYGAMMLLWVVLFALFNSVSFLLDHWHYPAIMVLGAFVAGLTPEGGGAVAFPVLSVFFDIKREMARDFSLMIQSIGMTSASIWILSRKGRRLADYRLSSGSCRSALWVSCWACCCCKRYPSTSFRHSS